MTDFDFARTPRGQIVGTLPNLVLALAQPAVCGHRLASIKGRLCIAPIAGDRWTWINPESVTAVRVALLLAGFERAPKGLVKTAAQWVAMHSPNADLT